MKVESKILPETSAQFNCWLFFILDEKQYRVHSRAQETVAATRKVLTNDYDVVGLGNGTHLALYIKSGIQFPPDFEGFVITD